jgi:hypothetical protein
MLTTIRDWRVISLMDILRPGTEVIGLMKWPI